MYFNMEVYLCSIIDLTKYFGFYSESHYQWCEGRERKEGFKGKKEREREREARGGKRGRRG